MTDLLPRPHVFRRFDLLQLDADAWAATRAPVTNQQAMLRVWADAGWPVIVRRRAPDENPTLISTGLPLPPEAGGARIAMQVAPEAVTGLFLALTPDDVSPNAPMDWWPTLDALTALSEDLGVAAHVFGSLMWQSLTGFEYLSPTADLNVNWQVRNRDDVHAVVAALEALDAESPMRLDGELITADGAGVDWRMARGEGAIVVKTVAGSEMRPGLFAGTGKRATS